MVLGCEFSNSVYNNYFKLIFKVSRNNHVVFDMHVKYVLSRDYRFHEKKIKTTFSLCLHTFT